jgi:hypothetical protein
MDCRWVNRKNCRTMAHINQRNLQFCPSLSTYLEPEWRYWYSDRTWVERLWCPNSLRFNGYRGSFPQEGSCWCNDKHFVPSRQYIHVVFYVMYTHQTSKLPLFRSFGKIAKATICFVMSVCLSVNMEQRGSNWTDFHKIL